MDNHSPEQRRKNMQAVRSTGSKGEVRLANALHRLGFRYRKNSLKIFGKPDLSFAKYKIAVFVDGEFWHGKDWELKKHQIHTNADFWHNKIEKTMARDKLVNLELAKQGWKVIRFWSKDVLRNLDSCVQVFIDLTAEDDHG